jgi:hypothetical protein
LVVSCFSRLSNNRGSDGGKNGGLHPPYACWPSAIDGSTKWRFFALLHESPVDSQQAAVRAAIVAEARSQKQ